MNIPEVASRANDQAPRVARLDFNARPLRAFFMSRPEVGERVIAADAEGNTVYARVVSTEKRAIKDCGSSWFTVLAAEWDTWRDGEAVTSMTVAFGAK